MRSQFKSYFPETKENLDEIWQEALIVLDANVLLNLYRYSEEASQQFIDLIEKNVDRVWLPEQAVYEFLRNRHCAIDDQAIAYRETSKKLSELSNKLIGEFSKKRGHPFISQGALDGLKKAVGAIQNELESGASKFKNRFREDEITDKLVDLLDDRIGRAFDVAELEEIFKEGATRYKNKIPPGYEDIVKVDNPQSIEDKRTVYGDLIIWKQTIEKSKEDGVPIILVTDDQKEDWWFVRRKTPVRPRPELFDEFSGETGKSLLLYTPEIFLKYAKEQLKANISKATIGEVGAEKKARSTVKRPVVSPSLISASVASDMMRRSIRNHEGSSVLENLKKTARELALRKLDPTPSGSNIILHREKIRTLDVLIRNLELQLSYQDDDDEDARNDLYERLEEFKTEKLFAQYQLAKIEQALEGE